MPNNNLNKEVDDLHKQLMGSDYESESDSKNEIDLSKKETKDYTGKKYQMPLKSGKLISHFVTKKRMEELQSQGKQPVTPGTHFSGHPAIDVQDSLGAPVYPIGPGVVTEVNSNPGNWKKQGDPGAGGVFCKIKHDPDDNLVSYYAHLSKVNVTVGEKVDMDTVIGSNGQTGSAKATAPHVHLGIKLNGSDVDPLTVIGKPIGSFKKNASKAERIYKIACFLYDATFTSKI